MEIICPRCNAKHVECTTFDKYVACPSCKKFIVNKQYTNLSNLKFGYFYWGYLSDKVDPNDVEKDISSPDGVGTFAWSIFYKFLKDGFTIYGPPIDRDKEIVKKYGKKAFYTFSTNKRWEVYNNIKWMDLDNFPDLDILLLENRFTTKDNSIDNKSLDLKIFHSILEHYSKTKTCIILLDLDYKVEKEVEEKVDYILEQGHYNLGKKRKSFFIPFDFEDMLQYSMKIPKRNKHLVYIGNNYNRNFDFNNKLIPYSIKNPNTVHLVGNWFNDKSKDFVKTNNKIIYHDRIGFRKFPELYGDAIAVPLLATEEYKKNGVMTMRIIETLLFGSIPIGFSDFKGINKWLPSELIVDMDNYEKSMEEVMCYLMNEKAGFLDRMNLRKELINKIKFHDINNLVTLIKKLYIEKKNGK